MWQPLRLFHLFTVLGLAYMLLLLEYAINSERELFNDVPFRIKVQTAHSLHLSPYGQWPWLYYVFLFSPVITDISVWRSLVLISFSFEATELYKAVSHIQNSQTEKSTYHK